MKLFVFSILTSTKFVASPSKAKSKEIFQLKKIITHNRAQVDINPKQTYFTKWSKWLSKCRKLIVRVKFVKMKLHNFSAVRRGENSYLEIIWPRNERKILFTSLWKAVSFWVFNRNIYNKLNWSIIQQLGVLGRSINIRLIIGSICHFICICKPITHPNCIPMKMFYIKCMCRDRWSL